MAAKPALADRHRPNLPGAANGRAAEALLGNRLPDVAKMHGLSVAELRRQLREDQDLWVDATDRLFYVEPELAEGPDAPAAEDSPPFDFYSPADAFELQSKPGSNRTIYLDFDGHTLTGTAWNSSLGATFNAPPFDLDGSPNTFNDTERLRIIEIWRRVSEDFAGMEVNVTTKDLGNAALERSSSTDQVYGTRALITKRNAACSGCGGVAYVGVFDNVGTYYQPAFVFYDALGNGYGKYVAEAVSHEVGHNGGLSHDGVSGGETYYEGHGSGETGWAPIMGVGYYRNNTQWSKGEYPNANNTQDDFTVWAQNGVVTRNDDHGDTIGSATPVAQSGSSFSSDGIIEDRADSDYFSVYVGAGDVSIAVEVAPGGMSNLDSSIRVYNGSGSLIAQANPAAALGSSISFSAAQDGTYYFSVEGVGYLTPTTGGYSDYGSVGYYRISGSANPPSGNQPPIAIADGSPLSGIAPLPVSFSGAASLDPDGAIVSYSWTFGDGQTGSGPLVSHTFSTAGSYNVVLTVRDDGGLSHSDSLTVTVSDAPNQPPSAAASATPTSGYAPLPVAFSSNGSRDSDGSIVSYQWNFGDGSSSTAANPSHTYSQTGSYTAVLTVTDDDGAKSTASVQISVSQDPNSLQAPTNLSASVSGTTVSLSWRDNTANETGYYVERGVSSGKGKNATINWTRIATLGINAASYNDNGVASGTYYYRVGAYRNANVAYSSDVKTSVGGKGGNNGGGKGGKPKK